MAALILDVTVLNNVQTLETSEESLLLLWLLRQSLGSANNVSLAVPELTFGVKGLG